MAFLGGAIITELVASFVMWLHSGWSITAITVTDLASADGASVLQKGGPYLIDTSGTQLPTEAALLIAYTDGQSGKQHRGRCYIPGMVAEYLFGDEWTPFLYSALQSAFFGAMMSAATATGLFVFAIQHRRNQTWSQVLSLIPRQPVPRSQRRRQAVS